ncbi:MAG TPA: hypothetical protein VF065_16515 [Ilumatobacter sp.]
MRGRHARHDRGQLPGDLDKTDFADECAAFLAGHWTEQREDRGRPLPPWAWLNPIAHGDLEDVRALAATVSPSPGVERLQVAVAKAVLNAVPASDLPRIQHDVLVPLELQLMDASATPRRILETVTTALY